MLQRYAVYKFSNSKDEMVDVCEKLFKNDIDRSQKTVKRTRRAIIFDRWVIQSQDDPSISEVIEWCKKANLKIYSSYPNINSPIYGDSFLHLNKCDPYKFKNLFSIPELTWMMQTSEDNILVSDYNNIIKDVNNSLQYVSDCMSNFSKKSQLDTDSFIEATRKLKKEFCSINFFQPLEDKLNIFLDEVTLFLRAVENGDLNKLKFLIDNFQVLFTGAVGVRHVDYIAYRPIDKKDYM